MKLPDNIFRLYDIRGIYGRELTEEGVYYIGRGLGTLIFEGGGSRAVVGHDVRLHSESLKEALIDGLRVSGITVYEIGMTPTPLMYFALHMRDVHGGIQVTASHNPPEYNGLKICVGKEVLWGEGIQELKKRVESEEFRRSFEKGKLHSMDIVSPYIEWMLINIKIIPEFRIGVDTGNGTTGPIIKDLLEGFGIEYKGIYLEPDGRFPNHLPDPTVVDYMKDLMGLVKSEDLDFGVGIDGDGDRIGIIDEEGELYFGDKVLAILIPDILGKYPNSEIVFDVKCSKGLIEFIESLGGIPYMWKTGHSVIKAKLKERENCYIAGEMSGHIFIKDRFFGHDDAIYVTARILETLSLSNKKPKEMLKEFPAYYSTPEIRVSCPDEKKFEVVDKLVNILKNEGFNVIDIDGARVEFEDGFGLVRASNTQPVLVLRCEGKTKKRLDEICELIYSKLKTFPEVQI